jgi:hypothetical protein
VKTGRHDHQRTGLGDGLDKSLSRRNKRTVNKQNLNIMTKLNNEMKAGTDARTITNVEVEQVCQPIAKPNVGGWHILPGQMPEIKMEVLVAIKYDNEPVQAYWDGREWQGSFLVRDNMSDGYVNDASFKHIQEWIYAWIELPNVPPVPEPF